MTTSPQSDRSRPEGRGRRPLILWGGLAAILVALAAFGLKQAALGADAARREVAAELAALTGGPVEASQARTVFRLLPVPRLTLFEVRAGFEGSGPMLSIERMTADLDLWSALLGRVRIERLVLDEPDLTAPALPRSGSALPEALEPILSRLHGLGDVEIRDGVLRRDANGAPVASAIHLDLSWPARASAADLAGNYVWNGRPVALSLELADPLAVMAGKASTLEFQMTSPDLAFAFAGEASATGRFFGRITASLPSLGRAVRWLAGSRRGVPEIGPLALVADLASEGGRIDLSKATVTIDEFAGRGALDLVFAGDRRPSLGGTLAFERLDLDGLAEALAPRPSTPIEATRAIPTDFVDSLDIDLRVSAETGRIGPLALSDLAGTIKMKDGVATLDIGDAGLLGGSGQMRVGIDSRATPPALKGSASMRGVDAGGLLAAFGLDRTILSGTADVVVDAASPITNWADILKRHRLDAEMTVRSGALSGLDPQVLTAAGRSTFDPAGLPAALPFAMLKAEIETWGSRMELRSLRLSSDLGTIDGTGLLLDGADEADLAGSFEPAPADLAASTPALTKTKPLEMTMRGSWPNPVVVTTAAEAGDE